MKKICNKCHAEYPATLEFFYAKGKGRLCSSCKWCCQEYSRQYRKTHKGQQRVYDRQRYQTLGGRLHRVYYGLDQRTTNPDHPRYKDWGGRGIRNNFKDFKAFYDYVVNELRITTIESLRGLQIHRINNDSHYMPGNIVFLTRAEHNAAHQEINRLKKLSR